MIVSQLTSDSWFIVSPTLCNYSSGGPPPGSLSEPLDSGLVCLKCRPATRPLHWSSASAKVSVNFLSVGDFELSGRDILKRCLSFLCFSRWNQRGDETQAAVHVRLWSRRTQAQTSGSLYKSVSERRGEATAPQTLERHLFVINSFHRKPLRSSPTSQSGKCAL